MTPEGVLNIFPDRGLDQSILVAILIGILILLTFTETLGWVFVGLVVPGYLSSVFVSQPSIGIIITVEGVITFVLVRFISDIVAHTGVWSPFFGRERFFIIVLGSVIVRQNSQTWLMPLSLGVIDDVFGTSYAFDRSEFYSIGLVLVPLVANMFWKLTLIRGLAQVLVPVGITYCILQFILLPYTNLSFSSVEITYDNIALDFIDSPKAYIILLTGAILAARFNVLYGWDYNGILVPSLLAIGWLSPSAIAITIAEVIIIFTTVKLTLMLPMLRTKNLEGPRQVVLVFSIGFVLKYTFAWFISIYYPHIKVTDYFGFGYVITSLIVVKMLQKKVIGRVILPTLHVSIVGFISGSLLGLVLDAIWPRAGQVLPTSEEPASATATMLRSPLGVTVLAAVRVRPEAPADSRQGRPPAVLYEYTQLWQEIDIWLATGSSEVPPAVAQGAEGLGLAVVKLPRHGDEALQSYALVESEERLLHQTGWETALLTPGAPGPIIEVPHPNLEAPTAEAAAVLCEVSRCRAILVSGLDVKDGGKSVGDPLAHPRSSFLLAAMKLTSAPILQLRADPSVPLGEARLHLRHKVPSHIHLNEIWPKEVTLVWAAPPGPELKWSERRDLLVLRAHPDAWWQLLNTHATESSGAPELLDGVPLRSFLTTTFGETTTTGTSQTVPSETEVRFFEQYLAAQLVAPAGSLEHLPWLNHAAAIIDYKIVTLEDCVEDSGCLVLTERNRPVRHRWGTLAVRTGSSEPIALEAPRPIQETGTWEMALELWSRERGVALAIGHDVPAARGVPKLDPVHYGNVVTPFHAMHQSIHRALTGRDKPFIAQVRGFGTWREIEKSLVIGLGPPVLQLATQVPARLQAMLAPGGPLSWMVRSLEFVSGESSMIALSGQDNPQLSFSRRMGGVEFALLWLSEPVREEYVDRGRQKARKRLESVGFLIEQQGAIDFLTGVLGASPRVPDENAVDARFTELLAMAEEYAITEDIHLLRIMRSRANRKQNVDVRVLWDERLSVTYIAVSVDGARYGHRGLVLLSDVNMECPDARDGARMEQEPLSDALKNRCRTITVHHRKQAK